MKLDLRGFTATLALGLGIGCMLFNSANLQLNTFAEDTVTAEDVLEGICAGAAEDMEVDIVPTDEEILETIIEANAWKEPGKLVMANVQDSVNVRQEPTVDSDKLGVIYGDCGGYIIEYTDTWTKVQSGNVVGWVCNDYLLFGDAAEAEAESVGHYKATINDNQVRIRKEPNLECDIHALAGQGDVFDVLGQEGDWLSVEYEGADGYINISCADVEFCIDYGETLQEIEDREAAERAAKREAERIQYYGVYAATASDAELLGALIQCEAGSQPYEGQVAVGAVVMNRLRSGAYPNTLYGVIYASGQFTPAGSGAVDRRIQAGVSESCMQAAREALGGYSNVGDATHFRPVGAHEGIVIGGHVFW